MIVSGQWRVVRESEGGFTLLEVLVALVIAAIAAAIILTHVRTLMLRAEKEQAHQLTVMQLLNDSAYFRPGEIPLDTAVTQDKEALIVRLPPGAGREALTVRVSNFTMNGEVNPPIDLAYTPFQRFEIRRDRYTLSVIGLSLKPPQNTQPASVMDAAAPASSVLSAVK